MSGVKNSHAVSPLGDPAEGLLIEGKAGIDPSVNDDARRQFRNTLGQFATGVTAMTTLAPSGERIGITVSSFNSLSLDPPLILWSLARSASSFSCFQVRQPFAVNVLSADQEQLARQFARVGVEKFEGVGLHTGLNQVPLIEGCVVYLECLTEARYPGGDHDIIVGRVRRIFNLGKAPLLFHGGILRSLRDVNLNRA
jgi:3-hydroxy-9,10-secoandrosta-1,3,5(10)-triene-9,17-dione monooxygenase reductase component